MRKIILNLIVLGICANAYSQKVNFKKDMITIGKEDVFHFVKTKDGNVFTGEEANFALSDMNGKELLIFGDSTMFYAKLPNEKKPRPAYTTMLCFDPNSNQTTLMPRPRVLNFRKYIVKSLEEVGFFKDREMTSQVYNDLMNMQDQTYINDWNVHIDTTNSNRIQNSELTKSKFGNLSSRVPGRVVLKDLKIMDGSTQIGYFKLKEKGSYAASYEIVNNEGYTIGTSRMILKENRTNVKSFVAEEFKWFYFKKDKEGNSLSPEEQLQNVARYLVEQGYL